MKKTIVILLSAIMAIALVACGGTKSEDKNSSEQEKATAPISSAPVSSEVDSKVTDNEDKSSNDAEISNTGTDESSVIDSSMTTKPDETHLYDRAVVKPMMNGIRTEKLGEYSIIKADSSECTEEALADWYYNYVAKHDFNYNLIIYTDKDESFGCYALDSLVQKGIGIEVDKYGDYSIGGYPADATTYIPSEDETTLTEIKD